MKVARNPPRDFHGRELGFREGISDTRTGGIFPDLPMKINAGQIGKVIQFGLDTGKMIANGGILLIKANNPPGDGLFLSGDRDEVLADPFPRTSVAVQIDTHDEEGISAQGGKVIAFQESRSGFDGVHNLLGDLTDTRWVGGDLSRVTE